MGTPLDLKYIPYTYMDPLGQGLGLRVPRVGGTCRGGCRGSIQVMRV